MTTTSLPLKLSVTLHTTDFRGDHAAEVTQAHEAKPGETAEQLVERVMPSKPRDSYHSPHLDRIVIQHVKAS